MKIKKENNIYSSAALRRLLISILFHTIDSQASDSYIRKQLLIAGATNEEIEALMNP